MICDTDMCDDFGDTDIRLASEFLPGGVCAGECKPRAALLEFREHAGFGPEAAEVPA